MMNKLLTNNVTKLVGLTVLLFSGFNISALNLDRIIIKNDFGQRIACQGTWRDRNGAHTTQITNTTINKGAKVTIKGPMVGYGIKELTATESAIVATVLAPPIAAAALILTLKGTTKPHGNKFFVITAGAIPKGLKSHKVVITGYKNEQAYNDAMAKNNDKSITNKQISEELALVKEELTALKVKDAIQDKELDNDDKELAIVKAELAQLNPNKIIENSNDENNNENDLSVNNYNEDDFVIA